MSIWRYEDKPISEVPDWYLNWIVQKAVNFSPEDQKLAQDELLRRAAVEAVRRPPTAAPTPATAPSTTLAAAAGPPLPPLPPDLSRESYLSPRQMTAWLSVSLRTLWRMRDDGRIPQPVRLGPQVLRWKVGDVEQHIQTSRPEQAGGSDVARVRKTPPVTTDDKSLKSDRCQPVTPMTTGDKSS
jgi:predicted DNA-binding transcriptional regulator AlpA